MYIHGIGFVGADNIQPRLGWNQTELVISNKLFCKEPDYKDIIPPMQLRRMTKVVRIGIAAAKCALLDAAIDNVDIITLGTAYGCLADTETFLERMIVQKEEMLTPTAFIQSTHNTVSGQIALMLSCHGHNFTYVQRGHSFECALQESLMWLAEDSKLSILVGGIDEMTENSFQIINRFGTYKDEALSMSKGTRAGEGAAMFSVSGEQSPTSYCKIVDARLCHSQDTGDELKNFLRSNKLTCDQIDVVVTGLNDDVRYDDDLKLLYTQLPNATLVKYKHVFGEYPTAASCGLVLSAMIAKHESIPNIFLVQDSKPPQAYKHILLHSHYKNNYHSFVLIKPL